MYAVLDGSPLLKVRRDTGAPAPRPPVVLAKAAEAGMIRSVPVDVSQPPPKRAKRAA